MNDFSIVAADIGKAGEEKAALYLERAGYRILDRNYANLKGIRLGEIDIVARKDGEIIFVEVKASFIGNGKENRLPEWKISPSKLRKMEKTAALYLKERQLTDQKYSFDAIAVTFYPEKEPEISHLDHIFYT